MLGYILVEDYSLPFLLPFFMVLVEVKTQNSFFMVRQNYLNTWRMMGGEYQKFERTLAKTAPKSFFYAPKIQIWVLGITTLIFGDCFQGIGVLFIKITSPTLAPAGCTI